VNRSAAACAPAAARVRRASAPAAPPGLKATTRNTRSPGAWRPCPVVAMRRAGRVFEPRKGSTMNARPKLPNTGHAVGKCTPGAGIRGNVSFGYHRKRRTQTSQPPPGAPQPQPYRLRMGIWRKPAGAVGARHSGRASRRRSQCTKSVSAFQMGMHCADTQRQLVAVQRGDRQLPRSVVGAARGH
jgi:hypothetical protein